MVMDKARLVVSISLLLLVGCTEPGEMTGVGAATGGVVGAGLGAIVGNQTGDPGAGLAIGMVAGAGAGAAIGNVLEAQDQAIKQQDEAIERQEQVIRAQRGEIDELRRGSGDFSGPRARLNAQNLKLGALPSRPAQPVVSKISRTSTVTTTTPPKPKIIPVLPKKEIVKEEVASESDIVDSEDMTGDTALVESDVVPEAIQPARVAPKAEPSADCVTAEEEYNQAAAKNEAPDKLFHVRRALRLCPTDARFHVALGDIYSSLNRSSDAQFEYKEALKLSPNDPAIKEKVSTPSDSAVEPY